MSSEGIFYAGLHKTLVFFIYVWEPLICMNSAKIFILGQKEHHTLTPRVSIKTTDKNKLIKVINPKAVYQYTYGP